VRLVIAGLAGAFLAAAPACAATQTARIGFVSEPGARPSAPAGSVSFSTSPAAPVAAGEVLFETIATGTALSAPDRSLANLSFSAAGNSAAAARAAGQALRQRLIEIARGFGAQPESGSNGNVAFPPGGGEEMMVMPVNSADDDNRLAGGFAAMGAIRLRLGSPGRLDELRSALEQAGALTVTGPIHILDDDSQARRRARDDALARAGEVADQFAGAHGLRVGRLISFSEISDDAVSLQALMNRWSGQTAPERAEVETSLSARVAFALVPQ
jgi:uncharacterized protein YggE